MHSWAGRLQRGITSAWRLFCTMMGLRLTVAGCSFLHLPGKGIEAHGAALTVEQSIFGNLREAIHCTNCQTEIDTCMFIQIPVTATPSISILTGANRPGYGT